MQAPAVPAEAAPASSSQAAAAPPAAAPPSAPPANAPPAGESSYSAYYRSINDRYGTSSTSSSNGASSAAALPQQQTDPPDPDAVAKVQRALADVEALLASDLTEQKPAEQPQQHPAAANQPQQQHQQQISSSDARRLARLAEPPTAASERWAAAASVAKSAVGAAVLSSLLLASHAFGLGVQWAGALAGAAGIAAWGLRKGALNPSGAAAAMVVGACTLGCSLRLGATLVAFFFVSSKLTAFKHDVKAAMGTADGARTPALAAGIVVSDAAAATAAAAAAASSASSSASSASSSAASAGRRDWKQVLCNGGVPTALAVAYGALAGCADLPLNPAASAVAAAQPLLLDAWRSHALTALLGGFLGYYACCMGDTWASELGVLWRGTPRLVTTGRRVRRGTNGAVSPLGLAASAAGGLFAGLVFYAAALVSPTLWVFEPQRAAAQSQWMLVPLGLAAGLGGSLLDSLLGATVQYSGYDRARRKVVSNPGDTVTTICGRPWLSNNQVNLTSASLTSAAAAAAALRLFG
jgi:uncharacterized membrane protein